MGNKVARPRQVLEERYTRPQGLYEHRDVDHKKLRRLILDAKLCPCYAGREDSFPDLDECPICFLYYPSLNQSRCCKKGICTECFLQMKPAQSSRPAQCPFCKTSNYAVEYHGVRSKEEKCREQLEEQKVIEAKIRIRQQELHDDEQRLLRKREMTSAGNETTLADAGFRTIEVTSLNSSAQTDDVLPREGTSSSSSRGGDYNLDLEDLMVMEAIWLSMQESGISENSGKPSETSPSSEIACAVAALAEHQGRIMNSTGNDTETVNYLGANRVGVRRNNEHASVVNQSMLPNNNLSEQAQNASVLPDSFEEQVMLAMALSLAEA